MNHKHLVGDADKHFIINPVTRAISNAENKKNKLMQNDHNSERFTFEVDRYVDGHDLTLCDYIRVHYSNVHALKGTTSFGVYEVTDLAVDTDNENKIIFSWLVSRNATVNPGPLNFLVTFYCLDNGMEVYRWSTDVNHEIVISTGMDNEPVLVETYPDVLNQWKEDLYAAVFGYRIMGVGPVEPTTGPYMWLNTSIDSSEKIQAYLDDPTNQ